MLRSRDELLDTLRRLEKNPATAHLMVRNQKGRRAEKPQASPASHVPPEAVPAAPIAPPTGLGVSLSPAESRHKKPFFLDEEEASAPVGPRNSRWMRADDVLDYLGVCRATLYRAINIQGFPRPRKLGNVSLWLRDEIDAFMMGLPVMEIPKLDWPDGRRPRAKKQPTRG